MSDEHTNTCRYETGRFRLRTESDYAIIDKLEEYPPIKVTPINIVDGSESPYADRTSVLHLLNKLADTNSDEHKHFYLKYCLDKSHGENDSLRTQNELLKETIEEYDHIFHQILIQIDANITDKHYRVGVQVSPKMYRRLSEIMRGKR